MGINKKKLFGYISPICPESPHERIFTKFCTAVEVMDVIITCGTFFSDRRFCGGSKMKDSHSLSQWLLTQGCTTVPPAIRLRLPVCEYSILIYRLYL